MHLPIALMLALSLLVGCREIPPLVSGTVAAGGLFLSQHTVVEKGKTTQVWELTREQLDQLFIWLQNHEPDWNMGITYVPPPLPSYSITVVHVDGSRTGVGLFSVNENWKETIHFMMWDGKGKLVYDAMAKTSTEEIKSLTELLAAKDPSLIKPFSKTGTD